MRHGASSFFNTKKLKTDSYMLPCHNGPCHLLELLCDVCALMFLHAAFFKTERCRTTPWWLVMARSVMARCIAMAAAVVALFALPSAFVPARQGAPAVSPAVAAGVAAGSMALPAWAYDMADAQILLARVPGGKRTKELGLVVPIPEEDGLTDGQIAALFVVALVGLIAAVDLGKTLYYGINPVKFKTAKGKGSITPFMKRLIENGY